MPSIAPPATGAGSLMAQCLYYLPRLMFLNTRYAPQTHWGDVAMVLRSFPEGSGDVGTPEFWAAWQAGWIAQGERYAAQAARSTTAAGRIRAERGASVSYHWSEFMDFGDRRRKLRLRGEVREHFLRSLDGAGLDLAHGEVRLDGGLQAPYWLIRPPARGAGDGPVPCVLMSNGLDSMTEVEVLALAEPYLERGIAALLFEAPGQGIQVGQTPLLLELETVVAELVEVLRREPGIAADRLAFFGISFGGYFTLRIAQRLGSLFRCLVNLSGGPRVAPFDGLPRRLKDDFRFVLACGEPVDMQARFDALELDPADRPGAPVLSVHGDRDDIFPLAGMRELDRAWGERHRLVVHEGEAHICPNLVNLWSTDAADWVADRLGQA
ncbi:alpha/beta hydrolase family protein [Phaeacidiphilus oryzae]|uniref:alpha/beta hydrolase family protein n=1 Tax=Phaeacidiphilus oryzae TaxID=348818 RepID=UPI000689E92E|nr:prolyl oligopeptidase family serine peptidase [Phaeacidiphilus oryzae]